MKKLIATHTDLKTIINALHANNINVEREKDDYVGFVLSQKKDVREVMMSFRPCGRKADEIIYEVKYTDEFNILMNGNN